MFVKIQIRVKAISKPLYCMLIPMISLCYFEDIFFACFGRLAVLLNLSFFTILLKLFVSLRYRQSTVEYTCSLTCGPDEG